MDFRIQLLEKLELVANAPRLRCLFKQLAFVAFQLLEKLGLVAKATRRRYLSFT
jgi:hypothetical protein